MLRRVASLAFCAALLAACDTLSSGTSTMTQPAADMTGRWLLSAPNAPSCGMAFNGAPGAREGTIAPEGGCPARFFTSRHWVYEQGQLVIKDHNNEPLAKLSYTGTRFEGPATAGMTVTLSRSM
jgi:hypothetical protein